MINLGFSKEDNTGAFADKNARMFDLALGLASSNIERRIKSSGKTPFRKGGLRSGVRSIKIKQGGYRVVSDKEYSAAMEKGEIKGSPIRNWTTPGTGPGWFKNAVTDTLERAEDFIKTAKQAVGMK